MRVGLRFYLSGAVVLLTLAGCGRGMFQYGERAPWRHEAEVACMKSGEVKLGTGVVRMEPIEGPGICGADFPLKVSVLGESPSMAYSDELRPPASIPNASDPRQPRWPASQPRYATPMPPVESAPLQTEPGESQPIQNGNMRWMTGPAGIERPQGGGGQPMSISPPGVAPPDDDNERATMPPPERSAAPAYPPAQNAYPPPQQNYPQQQRAYNPPASDIPDDAVLPPGRSRAAPPAEDPYAPSQGSYNPPRYQPPQRALPSLGPMRGPNATTAMMPATLTPTATLACPLVSALDRWIGQGVQPAAMRWFGSPVVTIKQISAYSCREMVGAGGHYMSEHAYGNALDVAGFTLADGRSITVKDGWHGSPEEQGFLHDVQLYACETFTTVLAPGYNVYHYNHIHVDLMQRASGRHPCQPGAIPGEVAAAKARSMYATQRRGPAYTGSIPAEADRGHAAPAVPGQDGYVTDDVSGWSGSSRAAGKHAFGAESSKTNPY
jgi:hypothetical protein